MIIAVPEQHAGTFSGLGIPAHTAVTTWFLWWCSVCRITPKHARWSHAQSALQMGDYHARAAQCHTVGQLVLFGDPSPVRGTVS